MQDVLDYRGGGGNDSETKNIGERWNTEETSNIINWAINGGVLPVEFNSEENQSLESRMQGELSSSAPSV
ncbi:hypothetical protein D3C83_173150 [compost metagenome]